MALLQMEAKKYWLAVVEKASSVEVDKAGEDKLVILLHTRCNYITVSYAVTCAPFLLKVYCKVWQWDGLSTRIMHTVKKALTTIVDTAREKNLHGWCPGNNDRVTLPTATAKDIQNPLCILASFSLEFHLPYWRDLTQTIDCFPFMIAETPPHCTLAMGRHTWSD